MRPFSVTELPWVDPWTALQTWKTAPWIAFLDSGGTPAASPGDERARWSFLCVEPCETLVSSQGKVVRNGRHVTGDAWRHLKDMHARLQSVESADLPFSGGLVGLTSYAAGMALEGVVSRHRTETPEILAASYDTVFAFDRLERRCFRVGNSALSLSAYENVPMSSATARVHFQPDMEREQWISAVREVVRLIGEGDIFQANLTLRWQADEPSGFDDLAVYGLLRQGSPAPFGAFLRGCTGLDTASPFSLLSASVERFLSLSPEGLVETRPIKGTAPLGSNAAETLRLAEQLRRDGKENAENLMITDLMRNDIGRVCDIGSVSVPQLCAVEPFAHVQHLVSCVQGHLKSSLDAFDLLRATLPPGSVTGAPKKRAMEIIDQIELSARGAYCGSVFRIGREGAMDSSVVIRSVERCDGRLRIGVGGGITWLSDPEREYDEMRLKGAALLKVFGE
ncbi:anthranilate synthase component I family protein [Acetobacter sp.]|jgi:para-aminobenzoate synthetase component 1|uniref:anthranilate synthase component I family protein n=1 Tax=Acetobacter sp. TaxID=440 RepID=UPI0025C01917|nr:anthranilate synthase component I family protein [Acetobacter sp.]MCH4091721.1 anthranilate synthase component I family protein [Acetobacter sp.]MCI1300422.1 anthranilate synthase component I family protein [Acetobacter sp.]MCI1316759.1 anthranilate synthase component I family protein [Acetobacter sp.]